MSAVHLTVADGVAEIRLDNPAKLNALTMEMIDALEAHADAVERDRSVRAVLLTATGERAFCVGADIREWSALDVRAFARDWVRRGHRAFDRIARLPVPTIAVISGHAFGGGLELAATCDLRVMAPGATLALPETGVGIVPGWSGTQRIAGQMPPAVLKEMALAGRRLSAERACSIGFVNAVADDPRAEADKLASEIVAHGPQATEVAKWLLASALGEDGAASIEALGGAVMAGSAEKSEGVAAFFSKRSPDFKGEST